MKSSTRFIPRSASGLRIGLLLALLGGCGGGVDSGGTGAAVYASGPINGYGSIVVNGVHFDDSASSISDDDGAPRNRDYLKLGMVVEARGSAISVDRFGDSNSRASSIVIGSEIVGPIDTVSLMANSFTVLGRQIVVQPTTVFADGLAGGLAVLSVAQVVEVHGLYNATDDRFTATRIELKPNPANYKVQGAITAPSSDTFMIGTLSIDYSEVQPDQRPANLVAGTILRVRLNPVPLDSGVWKANRLRDGTRKPDDGIESKVEGLIDSITSPTQFSVAGVTVTTSALTEFDPQNQAFLVGNRVEVEGHFSSGTLAARKVEIEPDSGDDFDFRGTLQAVSNSTLTIQGVIIDTSDPNIRFDNGGSPSQLVLGANVRVRATLMNGTQLKAYRIQFRN
jgi:hypothetical protein